MRRREKKIFSAVFVIVMTYCAIFLAGMLCQNGSNTVQAADSISREEWIHTLVDTFQMKIEGELVPDDYYKDVSESTVTYYRDILTAVNFGVIDLEAGEEFKPKDPVTREFAAQTLNFCLGYELEENAQYTMNDQDSLKYIQSDQVALNHGWFALIDGAFQPDKAVTEAEKTSMVAFAKSVLAASEIDENHKNTYEFAEGVIVVPEEISVELTEDHKVLIYDHSVELAEGDTFAVFSNGLAYVYKAVGIASKSYGIEVQTEDVDYDTVVKKYDAEGVIEANLGNFVPASDDIIVDINYEDGTVEEAADTSERARAARIQGSKKIQNIKFFQKIKNGKIGCTISNIKVNYRVNGFGDWLFSISGKAKGSCDIKTEGSLTLRMGTIPIAGVGEVYVDMIYSAEGSISVLISSRFETGIEKVRGQGIRRIKNFKTADPEISAHAELKAACKVAFAIQIPLMAKGTIYGEAGVKADADIEIYTDGKKPEVCMDLGAHMYATAGYSVIVFGQQVAADIIPIYTESNSPVRRYYHIEDNNTVSACKRADSSSHVGKRGYYSSMDSSGNYGSDWFIAPFEEEEVPIFEYTVDDAGNATITKYNGNAYTLTIPEELDGYPVTAIGKGAFRNNKRLGSVVIPDAVISIGIDAFNGCSNLQNVILPDNNKYTYIDEGVFANTTSLNDIQIPDYVTQIKYRAFYNCGLKSLKLNDDITYIGEEAFCGCTKLADLTLPKYLELYGSACFGGCNSLQSIEIPRYIKGNDYYPDYHYMVDKMMKGMFYGCDQLKEVKFAKGITAIPHNLFNGCTGIEEITIPDTVSVIGYHAFNLCSSLKKVNLPKSLTKIEVMAFRGCTSLENIDIPDSVTEISHCAFLSCRNLSEIKMPAKLRIIGTWAFKACDSLKTITIPKNVKEVPLFYDGFLTTTTESPFVDCTKLKEVILEDGMVQLANSLFYNFENLERIVIPDTVTEIGNRTFGNASALRDVTLSKNLEKIGDEVFVNCTSLEKIEMPDSINNMGTNLFAGCTLLSEVKLQNNKIRIQEGTFKNCTSLKKIELPGALQYIHANAFEGCEKLESITVPDGFLAIDENAFKNCKRLTSVDLKGNYVWSNAFENCRELTDVKMSDSIFNIGNAAFLNCTSIEKIRLSTGIHEIRDNTFEGCTYLNNLIIPYGVKSIGNEAFKNCTRLKNISIPKNVTSISDNAFSYPEEITIYGVKGSYAEEYANKKGMAFVEKIVDVEAVEMLKEKYIVTEGDSIQLAITISPEDCNSDVTWSSSDESVATVRNDGVLKAVKSGECTATVKIGNIEKTCRVIVRGRNYGLRLTGEKTLKIGTTMLLTCMDTDNRSIKAEELKWQSENPDIATVDQKGSVQGLKKGKTIIEVSLLEDPSIKGTFEVEVIDEKIKVTGISLDKKKLSMDVKDTYKLTASIFPEGANNQNITWASDNEEVAAVSDGTVTAKKVGTAIITATTEDGSYTAACTVTVTEPAPGQNVTGVTLSKETLSIEEGNCALLEAFVDPETAKNHTVTWSTSDEEIAEVDLETGIVSGVAEGTTTITATTEDGGYTADCEVTVTAMAEDTVPVENVSVIPSEGDLSQDQTIEAGKQFVLSAEVYPADATNQNVIWLSSNKEVATVTQEGTVTAVGAGEVTLMAISENGGRRVEYKIQVLPVKVQVTDIRLGKTQLSLNIGGQEKLTAEILPEEAADTPLIWKSDHEEVATVDSNGVVTATGEGTAVITVMAEDESEVTAQCTVQVSKKPDKPDDPNPPVDPDKPNPPVNPDKPVTPVNPGTSGRPGTTGGNNRPSLSVGSKKKLSSGTYKITANSAKREVTFVKPASTGNKSVTVPATVKIDGQTFKVTGIEAKAFKNNKKLKSVSIGKNVKKIGKEAFSGCKKLSKVTIKGTALKSIGRNTFKNINKKAVFKVPRKKMKQYKKLLGSKTGYKKTMKLK